MVGLACADKGDAHVSECVGLLINFFQIWTQSPLSTRQIPYLEPIMSNFD